MYEILESYIKEKLGKKPEGLEKVSSAFKSRAAKKNEVLLEMGDVCRNCYFIVNGCLKISTYDINGNESTTSLAFEREWRTSMSSFLNQKPANERIVAAEKSQVLFISRTNFLRFSQELAGFQQIYQSLLEESYTKSVERMQTMMAMDALDRVRWLLQEQPLIFTRLSNRLIASYLGISEATLSRLKSKL